MGEERLQKFIATCGVASRRKAEEMILNGQVKVNGIIVNTLGVKVNPDIDIVTVKNKVIKKVEKKIYIKLYKPIGYITTVKDQFGRKTVLDLINIKEKIYPIGRLDYDTSGLLLLTNDGDLANKLMHPKYQIYKTYVADIDGIISKDSINKLRAGVRIEDYKTSPAIVKILKYEGSSTQVEISIYEGKNRQVRKMFDSLGHRVKYLKRISFGKINLGNLNPGQWCYLNNKEINFLKYQED